ncbi:META domain-containing protein [Flavobacterium sp. xlx-214]|uniref:META domain-containing protein n=1 Tax=unclassified Flavobacterium TaxID=196869 RepID=UPI0013D8A385|nr:MULTISPECIES: META domain-containing protein [unclassified Flavobacterium]MBA5791348.1 META domain-containing protein [Flavobacterium sp. xlx-221]QMI83497.1 META domain-containing protein [Flavobacterium sp. xlx-214]
MKTFLTLGLIICLNLGMTSCSSSQTFHSNKATSEKIMSTLNNTSWVLKRLDVENRDFKPTKEQKELVLSFTDNYYGSSDGCNGQGGDFTIEDNKVTFGIGMSTMRYCGEEMKHLIYSVPFLKTKTITIKGKQLQLIDESGKVIATYIKKEA